ncbi:MAG: hypothetical protein ABIO36_05490 [Pyrinomonadaceae bacterium]
MKTMLKLTLMTALLVSTVMADGEMGSGGKSCTVNCPASPTSASATTQEGIGSTSEVTEAVIEIVEQYLLFMY